MLYLLQFACLILMLVCAFFIGITRIHIKWINRRYECSRWMIFSSLLLMAIHYFLQMCYGFRASDEEVGAVVNILVYLPCFTLLAMAIYNIEATHSNRKKMNLICAIVYAAMLAAFGTGYCITGTLDMGVWVYVMLAIFFSNMVYCIYMITTEIIRRKKIMEAMAANDMQPFMRYAHASLALLFLSALIVPFAILSTKSLYIVGPVELVILLFFIINFVAFGYSYVPTEELLDKERDNEATADMDNSESKASATDSDVLQPESEPDSEPAPLPLSAERIDFIQSALDKWCADIGYKDSSVNMLTLSLSLDISKNELSQFFSQCQNTTFRIWLGDIRFNAAKKMMKEFPDYNNDIISAECGFSSRSYLYRIFKEKEGCTPVEWRAKNS